MEDIMALLGEYSGVIITVLGTLIGSGALLKLGVPDKYLKYFFKSGELAEEYAELVDKVEKRAK